MFRHGLAGGQCHIHINLAQEKHGPGFAVQQQRVLAPPALAAAGCQFGFQHRRRIGKHAVTKRPNGVGNTIAEFLQAIAQDLVVVSTPCIDRHNALTGAQQALQFHRLPALGGGPRQIVHARSDDAQGAWHQFSWARTLQAMTGHIVHFAMKALLQPCR